MTSDSRLVHFFCKKLFWSSICFLSCFSFSASSATSLYSCSMACHSSLLSLSSASFWESWLCLFSTSDMERLSFVWASAMALFLSSSLTLERSVSISFSVLWSCCSRASSLLMRSLKRFLWASESPPLSPVPLISLKSSLVC